MRTRCTVFAALLLLLPIGALAAEPTTLEEVTADITAKVNTIETYALDFESVMNMGSMMMNFGGAMQGKGKMMITSLTIDMMQQKMAMKTILDKDNIMWMDMDMMGMKQVMKMDMTKMTELQDEMMGMPGMGALGSLSGGGMQGDPRLTLEQAAKVMNLKYVGKEMLGDLDVYVIEGTLKDEIKASLTGDAEAEAMGLDFADMLNLNRMKFGVNDGFIRTMEMLDKAGAAWMTQTYKNLAFNEPMDDALFTYTPAEGVAVMDMTEMMDAGLEAPDAPEDPEEVEQP